MDLRNAVNIVNHGQTPVTGCDQPLYKIAQDIQWTWSETHGGDSYVVMLGGLHIKMTLLKYIAALLNRRGWTSAISQANITTPGTAESFLKASHVTKTELGITRWQFASNISYDKMPTPKMTLKYIDQIGQRSEVQVVYSANFGKRF